MALRETLTRPSPGPSARPLFAGLAVAIVLVGVLAYAFAPFRAAGGLKCKSALLGSAPKERATTGLLVGREDSLCQARGNSRLIISGIAAVTALTIGLAAAFLPVGPVEELFIRRDE